MKIDVSQDNNFTALNTPEDHPVRDMHDTTILIKIKKHIKPHFSCPNKNNVKWQTPF